MNGWKSAGGLARAGKAVMIVPAALAVACGAVLSACGSAPAHGGTPRAVARSPRPVSAAGTWAARTVVPEPSSWHVVSQALDPRTGDDFALTGTGDGPYRLRRTALGGGRVTFGPRFAVSSIGLAGGSLWVFGPTPAIQRPSLRLYQVSPRSLAVVRAWKFALPRGDSGLLAVAAGRHATVWVAFGRTVLHISARSGATVGRFRIPAGLAAGDVAPSPDGRRLYVAASNRTGSRSPVLEYAPARGRLLAVNASDVHAIAFGGGALTAVPGGVWVSFRTGMAGETLLLRQRDLHLVRLAGSGRPRSLFAWQMWAATEFAGTSVYLIRLDRVAACLGPATGHVRARGVISGQREIDGLLGAARGGRVLYALSPAGVIAVFPPAACRSG